MKINKSIWCGLTVLVLSIGCGESKKSELPKNEESVVEKVDEAAIIAAQIKKDSLEQLRIADSIKQDSLRQVKEHGHVH